MSYPIASRDYAVKQKRENSPGNVYPPPIEHGPQVYNLASNVHFDTYSTYHGYYQAVDISSVHLDAAPPCLPQPDSYLGPPAVFPLDG